MKRVKYFMNCCRSMQVTDKSKTVPEIYSRFISYDNTVYHRINRYRKIFTVNNWSFIPLISAITHLQFLISSLEIIFT